MVEDVTERCAVSALRCGCEPDDACRAVMLWELGPILGGVMMTFVEHHHIHFGAQIPS
jgi:hypothetical protein